MLRWTVWTLSIVLILLVDQTLAATDKQPIIHEPTVYWWRGCFSDITTSHDAMEITMAGRLGQGPFGFEYPMPPLVSFLQLDWRLDEENEPISYYNFRSGLLLMSTVLDWWLHRGEEEKEWRPGHGLSTHLLYLHNCSYKLRLHRNWRLAVATRTDLLPFRVHGDDQGMLFSPELALEWVGLSFGYEGDTVPATNRLHVGLGHSWWWSFEGQDRTPGWTLVVGIAFLAGV